MNTNTKKLPDNIKTWVDALESGDWDQTTVCLHDGSGYCCIGVYAKVVLGLSDKSLIGELDHNGYPVPEDGPTTAYRKVRSSLNIPPNNYSNVYNIGMEMNDDGESFVDIAKMIRESYA